MFFYLYVVNSRNIIIQAGIVANEINDGIMLVEKYYFYSNVLNTLNFTPYVQSLIFQSTLHTSP